jgi:hypothetical protein
MESEQNNKQQPIPVPLNPADEVKNSVVTYRLNTSEPIEPVLFINRKMPPEPQCRWGFWHDPQLPLLCGLGMPSQVERVLILEPGKFIDEKYKDFAVELFGVRAPIPDDFPFPLYPEMQEKHWSAQQPERGVKLDGLRPAGYVRFQESDTKGIIEMQVWRHRVYLDNSPIYVENLWSVSTGWIPMICGIQFANPAKTTAQLKRLADGYMLGFLAEDELNRETRGGAHNIRYPYSGGQKVALNLRYKEIIEEYKRVCKTRKILLRDHPNEKVRSMIESGFTALKIPQNVMDRLLEIDRPPSERSARPLALEHAAMDTLREYTSWLYGENDLLYLQREGEKLHKNGMQPVFREE